MNRPLANPLRAAVVGTGYLGRFHAQKYAALDGVELIAVVDTDPDRAAAVGAELGVPGLTDARELAGGIDVASVAVPTSGHRDAALPLLAAGVHLLVEKPLARTEAEAAELIAAAAAAGVVLQVGHLERFNPAVRTLTETVKRPLFVEAHRLGVFTGRATDVDVVLDLMIHDLDILLSLVQAPLVEVRATGVAVVTGNVDLANARLTFADGCTANLTASRISDKDMRRFRVFHRGGYVAADCAARENVIWQGVPGATEVPKPRELRHGSADHLLAEIVSFLEAVRGEHAPLVDGAAGLAAMTAARRVNEAIAEHAAGVDPHW